MTYQKGSSILASDFNGFLTTVSDVYGVGDGDSGYGQSSIVQSAVTAGTPVDASQWVTLRSMIVVCANQQGTNISTLPPSTVFATGLPIIAEEQAAPSSRSYEWAGNIAAIQTNRLNTSDTSMSVTTDVWSVTDSSSWSGTITAVVTATWASEDAARYFFNSGGQIRIYGATPTVSAVDFEAHQTVGGSSTGFYGLSDSYQILLSTSVPTGASYHYEDDTVVVSGKRLNYVGVNGGNGNGVEFQIVLTGGELISGTTFSFDIVRATTYLTGIASPTWATVTPF